MRRVMALWLVSFSTDRVTLRLRRRHGAPANRKPLAVLLTRAVGGRELIERCCPLCVAAGVYPGMDLAQARSLAPTRAMLHVEPHRHDRDAAALYRLACWCLRVSPTVAKCGDDGLLLDLTGTEAIYKGERRVARSVTRAIVRLGFRVRVGIAGTFACAMAMARFASDAIAVVEPDGERAALEALPAAALTDDPALLEGFAELGIRRAGDVLLLSRRQLASRFGLPLLHRIDQALGAATESVTPIHPPPPIEAELLFDGPTDRFESVEAAARDTLASLVEQVAARQRGVRRLTFLVMRPRGEPDRLTIELSRASLNHKHLWTLLRSQMDKVDLGEMVDGLRAVATCTARLKDRQAVHLALADEEAGDQGAALGELADTLVNRLGADNVLTFAPRASWLPEQSFAAHSVMAPVPRSAVAIAATDQPTRLFDPPEPASVMALTPDGPVLELGWRGERQRVASCIGPERLGAEWWRWRGTPDAPKGGPCAAPPPARDYFAVELESGRWLWVCRQADTTRWFVHGEWA
ncbi:MAG: DNA polymerase Y family protein [Phycisphaerales bacterium]